MENKELINTLQFLFAQPAEVYAQLKGSSQFSKLTGRLDFFPLWNGTVIMARVTGLPSNPGACASDIFGFHIHGGNSCEGDDSTPAFPKTGEHYNPGTCSHPEHAGDLPPLFGNGGFAFQIFYTDRFVPEEIIGKTVVIHSAPDDFTSQPSGNSGEKIACGEIKSTWNMSES
ncbi:MAG: superoxide dismutase family protein [Blautia sp.]